MIFSIKSLLKALKIKKKKNLYLYSEYFFFLPTTPSLKGFFFKFISWTYIHYYRQKVLCHIICLYWLDNATQRGGVNKVKWPEKKNFFGKITDAL